MTVLEPTPHSLPALAEDGGLAPRGPFAVTLDFLRRQPVGAIGMALVLIFGLAGVFANWLAPYNPTANDFAAMTQAPNWAHLARYRRVRPRYPLAHPVRRAHRLHRRPDLGSGRRVQRPHPRGRQRLFRRLDRSVAAAPARYRHLVPADHHGAGRRLDLRHRRAERHHRDHDPADPALLAGRALLRAGDPRGALCRCRARPRLRPYADHPASHGAQCDGPLSW